MKCVDHLGNEFKSNSAMCRAYGVSCAIFKRRSLSGMSLEDCLTKNELVYDHKGKGFKTISEMCIYWHVERAEYSKRIKRGMSVEEALTYDNRVSDDMGNLFNTTEQMCAHYGISTTHLYKKLREGYQKADILKKENNTFSSASEKAKVPCQDFNGKDFDSVRDMCDFWGVNYGTYISRRSRGFTLQEGLEGRDYTVSKVYKELKTLDHMGNRFESVQKMCDFWGVKVNTFYNRRKNNSSLEECLTGMYFTDPKGKKFRTEKDMCDFWGIKTATYKLRISKGYSKLEALTIPLFTDKDSYYRTPIKKTLKNPVKHNHHSIQVYFQNKGKDTKDHEGNAFNSQRDMCEFYHIKQSTYLKRRDRGWTKEEALTLSIGAHVASESVL